MFCITEKRKKLLAELDAQVNFDFLMERFEKYCEAQTPKTKKDGRERQ